MTIRTQLLDAFIAYAEGNIEKHRMNVEIYLDNPVGIGEHSDIMTAIETEVRQIAEYHDLLEAVDKYIK